MDKDQYQPIACAAYDIFEIAIMRGQQLDMHWVDEQGGHCSGIVQPLELKVSQGEEFLIFKSPDVAEQRQVRLDRISTCKIKEP